MIFFFASFLGKVYRQNVTVDDGKIGRMMIGSGNDDVLKKKK